MNETRLKRNWLEESVAVLAWICFFLAVITAVITIFAAFSGEENGKEVFGAKLLIVTSNSMSKSELSEDEEISFAAGDVIIIKKVEDPTILKKGDVVTFTSESIASYGKTVTHKIKDAKYTPDGKLIGYVTYGINTGTPDSALLKPENVIGKYCFKIPKVGHLFQFLKTDRGFYLSVLIPSVLLIILFSIRVGKALGSENTVFSSSDEIEALKKRVNELEKQQQRSAPAVLSSILIRAPEPKCDNSPVQKQSAPSKSESIPTTKPSITKNDKSLSKENKKEIISADIGQLKLTSVMSALPSEKTTGNRIKFTVDDVVKEDGSIKLVISKKTW